MMLIDSEYLCPRKKNFHRLKRFHRSMSGSKGPIIFFSLRFNPSGPEKEAKLLKDALAVHGVNAVIIDTENGRDIRDEVFYTIANAKMFVVFGTADYGVPGKCDFSTKEEFRFAIEEKIPIFLIKMCPSFNDAVVRAKLPASMKQADWTIGKPVPEGLVQEVLRKFNSVLQGNTHDSMRLSIPYEGTIPEATIVRVPGKLLLLL